MVLAEVGGAGGYFPMQYSFFVVLMNNWPCAALIDALTTALPSGSSIWIEFMSLPVAAAHNSLAAA